MLSIGRGKVIVLVKLIRLKYLILELNIQQQVCCWGRDYRHSGGRVGTNL